jgi:MPBQ/MSBQ methyltransferase
VTRRVRLLQHKTEAYWFYRVLSLVYDGWVNPLFWTPAMRADALEAAALDARGLRTLDVGAGTGFTTEGIVATVDAGNVTMLDQSPHQLARAEAKPALARCAKVLGDAEDLPFPTDHFDRYVSAGSIEYWPEPQRAIAEAYRVLRPGATAALIGPVRPGNPLLRRLAETWMLFPTEAQYRDWFTAAGFDAVALRALAPDWYRSPRGPYAVVVSGNKPGAGPSPLGLPPPRETARAPLRPAERARVALRFAVGSLAGALFVPVGAALALRHRLRARS